eukprot:TRINITY_DN2355_c0_g1_i1.p1 TRINITY_DN2355_c0_g1~~TRINITY_DN2355_c0_g1_i1.p1  ORF type:complete len:440 (-),score=77.47 TRINITY_DN2355_c0_g1_i1:953-2272(-)
MAIRRFPSSLRPLAVPARFATSSNAKSPWANVEKGPEDPILGLTIAYKKDTDPRKVNLGVGAYRNDDGKPLVLKSVRAAEELLTKAHLDMEYLPIAGLDSFLSGAQNLLFGEQSPAIAAKRIASVQTISGTGALRVAGEFIRRFYPYKSKDHGDKPMIAFPAPTWGNHGNVFRDSGLAISSYRYYDPSTCGLDFNAMMEDLNKLPDGTIVLLHACAHNPTGVDPEPQQWDDIINLLQQRNLYPFVDSAYQGFASGDPVRDAMAVRKLDSSGLPFVVTQSFAKNFGLYGQRIGACHFVSPDEDEATRVLSQVKILIRPMYSNPPIHGARIVSAILSDQQLTAQWSEEVKGMADRIISMRKALRELLEQKTGKEWPHVTKQIGMFCFTGLHTKQVERMIAEHHIYMTKDGRISMAGITTKNVEYVASAIAEVSKSLPAEAK